MTQGGRHVVVVGGGITGLAAAHALVTAAHDGAPLTVTVLESDQRTGGKIATSPFAGLGAVDEGADAVLARVPFAVDLMCRVGLDDRLTSPAAAHAAVWWDGLHRIPEGLLLGVPTDAVKLARSSLLSWRGKARAAAEPLVPRSRLDAGPGNGDGADRREVGDSIGRWVRGRFGDEVHERLVDPLVGSIYAADTDRFSLTAVPQLADLADGPRSVLLGARPGRRPAPPSGPVFQAPLGGMGEFVRATADAVIRHGGAIRTGAPVAALEPEGTGWRVALDDGSTVGADAVVLACPAAVAARLLGDDDLATIEAADVALVALSVPTATWPDRLAGMSGYLVPKPRQRLVTAVSFGSQKWAHWRTDDRMVLRISLGRDGLPVLHLDDDALVAAAVDETSEHLGLRLEPCDVRVTRWAGAFPQYRPYHHRLVDTVERRLPSGVAIAGASYHGIGIPACVRSGERAAARVVATMATDSTGTRE